MSSSSKSSSIAKVGPNRYGKAAVKLMRIVRKGSRHEVSEIDVRCLLVGDFDSAFERGTNENILPTDTVKNTIYALSKKGVEPIEKFAQTLSEHFLSTQKQVDGVEISIERKNWERLSFDGTEHNHAFRLGADVTRGCSLRHFRRSNPEMKSYINNLTVLKTTQSGFEGFIKDDYTSLPEVRDRVFCTKVNATWSYNSIPNAKEFPSIISGVEDIVLRTFAGPVPDGVYSPSVQQTLYEAGEKIIAKYENVEDIDITMPNLHYFPYDLGRFGITNDLEVMYPAYEPHGYINCCVVRNHRAKL